MYDTMPRPMDIEDLWWLAQVFALEFPDGVVVYRESNNDWLHVHGQHQIYQEGFFASQVCTAQVRGFGETSMVATVPCLSIGDATNLALLSRCLVLRHLTHGQKGEFVKHHSIQFNYGPHTCFLCIFIVFFKPLAQKILSLYIWTQNYKSYVESYEKSVSHMICFTPLFSGGFITKMCGCFGDFVCFCVCLLITMLILR